MRNVENTDHRVEVTYVPTDLQENTSSENSLCSFLIEEITNLAFASFIGSIGGLTLVGEAMASVFLDPTDAFVDSLSARSQREEPSPTFSQEQKHIGAFFTESLLVPSLVLSFIYTNEFMGNDQSHCSKRASFSLRSFNFLCP